MQWLRSRIASLELGAVTPNVVATHSPHVPSETWSVQIEKFCKCKIYTEFQGLSMEKKDEKYLINDLFVLIAESLY